MGIPGFNKWFKENHGKCYVPLNKISVDHLYLDMNSIIHNSLRNVSSWEGFHKRLHKRLNNILDLTAPNKTVMLAVDGPAPLAKLLTQRERRKKGNREVSPGDVLTGNAITPGTIFMADLTQSLAFWIHTRLGSAKFRHLQFELSDATVMGEGEVKILGRLARPWHPIEPSDTHVIVGDDADLVLMALISTYHENLYVVNAAMNSENNLFPTMPVFCVNSLHQQWMRTFIPADVQLTKSHKDLLLGLKMDLTLLAVVSKGNDYLPALRGVGGLEDTGASKGLWSYYKQLRKQQDMVERSIVHLGADGMPFMDLEVLSMVLTQGRVAAQSQVKQWHREGREQGTYEVVKGSADAENYLMGCCWLLNMYHKGDCPDYRFHYDGVAPSTSKFAEHCMSKGMPTISHSHYLPVPEAFRSPPIPYISAMALLPASSRHLLPRAVQHLMSDASPLYDDLYEECGVCETLSQEASKGSRKIVEWKSKAQLIEKNIKGAVACDDHELVQSLTAKLAEAEALWEEGRREVRDAQHRRDAHMREAHPYQPFPLERLVATASAVDLDQFEADEVCLTSFSQPLVSRIVNAEDYSGRHPQLVPSPHSPFDSHTPGRFIKVVRFKIIESTQHAVATLQPDDHHHHHASHPYKSKPQRMNQPQQHLDRGAADSEVAAAAGAISRAPADSSANKKARQEQQTWRPMQGQQQGQHQQKWNGDRQQQQGQPGQQQQQQRQQQGSGARRSTSQKGPQGPRFFNNQPGKAKVGPSPGFQYQQSPVPAVPPSSNTMGAGAGAGAGASAPLPAPLPAGPPPPSANLMSAASRRQRAPGGQAMHRPMLVYPPPPPHSLQAAPAVQGQPQGQTLGRPQHIRFW